MRHVLFNFRTGKTESVEISRKPGSGKNGSSHHLVDTQAPFSAMHECKKRQEHSTIFHPHRSTVTALVQSFALSFTCSANLSASSDEEKYGKWAGRQSTREARHILSILNIHKEASRQRLYSPAEWKYTWEPHSSLTQSYQNFCSDP
jgi:hypothetical protein